MTRRSVYPLGPRRGAAGSTARAVCVAGLALVLAGAAPAHAQSNASSGSGSTPHGGMGVAPSGVSPVSSTGAAAAPTVAAEAPPDGILILPLTNASPVKQLDWMSAALAVTLAEQLETVGTLRPLYGPLVLEPSEQSGASPSGLQLDRAASRAAELGARWVLSGEYARPNWKSELALRLYAVEVNRGGRTGLRLVAEERSVGERAQLLEQQGALLAALATKQLGVGEGATAALRRAPTKDLYALTLLGRGASALVGVGEPRDLAKAEKALRRVCLIDPKYASAHRLLGMLLLEKGQRQSAAFHLGYALDHRPSDYAAMAALARLAQREGARDKAIALCEKVLGGRPWDAQTRQLLGELLWERADLDRARVELERVIALQPRNLSARRTLALIHSARGEVGELAAELERVLELSSDDVEVRLDLGSAYQRLARYDRAIAAYEEVLRRQPRQLQALKLLGDCYRRTKDSERAIAAYLRMRKLAPDDPRPLFLLGAAYEEAQESQKAEAAFLAAQESKRYVGEAWTNLGALAYRRGDLATAFWYLSRAVSRVPNRPKVHYNFALVLAARKERERALDELKLAGELDPEDPEIPYLSGVTLLRMGRLDEARGQFTEALRRRPEHADARHNLALLDELDRRYGGERSAAGAR